MTDTAATAWADSAPPLDEPVAPTGRARTSPINGAKGGRPPGKKTDPRIAAAAARKRATTAETAAAARAAAAGGQLPPDDTLGRIISPTPGPGRPSKLAAQSQILTTQLAAIYELVGAAIETGAFITPRSSWWFARVGAAFKINADRCARSIVDYSENNPRVRRFLESAGGTAGLLSIVLAHAAILMAVVSRPPTGPAGETGDSPLGAMFDGLDMSKIADLAAQMFPSDAPAPPATDDTAAA